MRPTFGVAKVEKENGSEKTMGRICPFSAIPTGYWDLINGFVLVIKGKFISIFYAI